MSSAHVSLLSRFAVRPARPGRLTEPGRRSLFGFPPTPHPKFKMSSSTSPSSVVTSQTASIAQTNVLTNASTLASVFSEGSLEVFALDQIHDFYRNGYSQDEADMVTLFLGQFFLSHFLRFILNPNFEGVSAVVYLIGYIASILILRHRRNKRKVSYRSDKSIDMPMGH